MYYVLGIVCSVKSKEWENREVFSSVYTVKKCIVVVLSVGGRILLVRIKEEVFAIGYHFVKYCRFLRSRMAVTYHPRDMLVP